MSSDEVFWIMIVPTSSFVIGFFATAIFRLLAERSRIEAMAISVAASIIGQLGFHFVYGVVRAHAWGFSESEAVRAGVGSVFWLSFGILLVTPLPTILGSVLYWTVFPMSNRNKHF